MRETATIEKGKLIDPVEMHSLHRGVHDVSQISGTYIFTSFGTYEPNNWLIKNGKPTSLGPYNSIGKIIHDGKGNFTTVERLNFTDKTITEVKHGTYTVCGCRGGFEVTYKHSGFEGVFARYTPDLQEGRGMCLFPGIISTILSVKI